MAFITFTTFMTFVCSALCSKKWTLEVKNSRFLILVLIYSSYNAVFLYHGFSEAQKTTLKEECLYLAHPLTRAICSLLLPSIRGRRVTNRVPHRVITLGYSPMHTKTHIEHKMYSKTMFYGK